jgi:hypothetical protein
VGTPVTVPVEANDLDVGSAVLTVVEAPATGTATVVGSSIRYTPTGLGSDSFSYSLCDDLVRCTEATVSVTTSVATFRLLSPKVGAKPARAKAGRDLAVRFDIGGFAGLGVLAAGSPATAPATCVGVTTDVAVPLVVTAGPTYDARSHSYSLQASTLRAWSGTCRLLTVTLADGSSQSQMIRFG